MCPRLGAGRRSRRGGPWPDAVRDGTAQRIAVLTGRDGQRAIGLIERLGRDTFRSGAFGNDRLGGGPVGGGPFRSRADGTATFRTTTFGGSTRRRPRLRSDLLGPRVGRRRGRSGAARLLLVDVGRRRDPAAAMTCTRLAVRGLREIAQPFQIQLFGRLVGQIMPSRSMAFVGHRAVPLRFRRSSIALQRRFAITNCRVLSGRTHAEVIVAYPATPAE
ncbi:hypothetical protein D7316_00847 [Gordonia insulae]|uniref:Uncharacterized protein n=1 Tax=Gordonia insulae TaxID=2420509 RepID=A0A3G8JGY2_9ACTN|nr:hypothetical protein D7316_00847 [Gordonia insulae]